MIRVSLTGVTVGMALNSANALAAPLAFDCDVPADRYSSVTQELELASASVKGVVQVLEMRSGNNLPVAGVRIADRNAKSMLGFQLIAASQRSEVFDVVSNKQVGGKL